ncbi:MAG: hypothetical protein LBN96_02860 [Desulfovibrio sp.]|jgi:hypothetical protein|nr:hypothetical protein [Desulfovibrio sp.]
MRDLKEFCFHDIDWELTPEQAVTMYLEWGNNDWRGAHPPVRSRDDVSLYFVVDSWQNPPVARLVRRGMDGAEDLAAVPLPDDLLADFHAEHGNWRGVSAPTPAARQWLKRELGQE